MISTNKPCLLVTELLVVIVGILCGSGYETLQSVLVSVPSHENTHTHTHTHDNAHILTINTHARTHTHTQT